jgi:hypothetical protein
MVGKTKFELSGIVKRFGKQLIEEQKLSPQQTKSLLNIVRCRTASLGGHEEVCDSCGSVEYSYNSCGDRHCPKCQMSKQALWIEKLENGVLPVKHYHIIFTVPHSLNDVCLWNDRMYYGLLFKTVWDTLRSFAYTHYGVESGAVAVLHSWGQNLSLHPHIHCIVPAAGFSLKAKWKNMGRNDDKYLYPVHQLSAAFKGKFLDALKRKLRKLNKLSGFMPRIQKAYGTDWVVYSRAPMSGVKQIIRYLGQYTHRIAISNQRILDVGDKDVVFQSKDYRDNATVKKTRMRGKEFLRRFVRHILPKGFVRIRRYGIYNPTVKRNLGLQFTEGQSGFDKLIKQAGKNETKDDDKSGVGDSRQHICPCCKTGKMIRSRTIPRIRSPPGHLPSILKSFLY